MTKKEIVSATFYIHNNRRQLNKQGVVNSMKSRSQTFDVVVIGGGLAGICAAISSARVGCHVALVQNRSVLGGNSSSEIRVWVGGASKHGINRYGRENGIMGELFVENQYRNPDGNPYLWDVLLLEKVRAEPNISLYLDTEVLQVEMKDEQTIQSVTGFVQGSETQLTFVSNYFIDCTGDGVVAFNAGADYHLGRESRETFGESLAPKVADQKLLGSSLFFYTKDVGHPVTFVKPFFARDITQTEIVKSRVIKKDDNGCAYWWIEWGGDHDIVHDNEMIRDELQAAVYGIWDYIKNSGNYDADNLTLEWVGSVVGKREYRRFLGDYVLRQQDIEEQTDFVDKVAFGGWSIDIHPASGMYTKEAGTEDSVPDGLYHIPLRSLYSRNIHNLFLAGRDISVSHVAFGSTRVMATCAIGGQAAGLAAAFAWSRGIMARDIYQNHLAEFQRVMLREDSAILGLGLTDPDDLMPQASVTASHSLTTINTYREDSRIYPLTKPVAFMFPVNPEVRAVDLMVDAQQAGNLQVSFYQTGKGQNYIPDKLLKTEHVTVAAQTHGWVTIPFVWRPDQPQNVFVKVTGEDHLNLRVSRQAFQGVLSFINEPVGELKQPKLHHFVRTSPILKWTNQTFNRENFVFRVDQTAAFTPEKVTNGYIRPFSGPNMWVAPVRNQPENVTFEWTKPQTIQEVRMILNDDLNEDLINLHHHRTAFPIMPELLKDFTVDYLTDQGWQTLANIQANRKRHVIIRLPEAIRTQRIRIRTLATNGSEQFSIVEVRAYSTIQTLRKGVDTHEGD